MNLSTADPRTEAQGWNKTGGQLSDSNNTGSRLSREYTGGYGRGTGRAGHYHSRVTADCLVATRGSPTSSHPSPGHGSADHAFSTSMLPCRSRVSRSLLKEENIERSPVQSEVRLWEACSVVPIQLELTVQVAGQLRRGRNLPTGETVAVRRAFEECHHQGAMGRTNTTENDQGLAWSRRRMAPRLSPALGNPVAT
jgi:hypothetical protein